MISSREEKKQGSILIDDLELVNTDSLLKIFWIIMIRFCNNGICMFLQNYLNEDGRKTVAYE